MKLGRKFSLWLRVISTHRPSTGRAIYPNLVHIVSLFGLIAAVANLGLAPLTHHPYDADRLILMFALAGIAFAAYAFSDIRRGIAVCVEQIPPSARFATAMVFVLGTISAFLAPNTTSAFREITLQAALFLFGASVAASYVNNPRATTLWLTTIITSVVALITLHFFSDLATGLYSGRFLPARGLDYSFSNIRFLAQIQTLLTPLLVLPFAMAQMKGRFYLSLLTLMAAAWWVMVFWDGSRGSITSLTSALIITATSNRAGFRLWLGATLPAFLFGALAYGIIFFGLWPTGAASSFLRDTSSGRLSLWHSATEAILAHPWLGLGPYEFANHVNALATHPHNSLLQMACEWGLPATLIMVALIIGALQKWLIAHRRGLPTSNLHSGIRAGLTISLLAGLIHSLVSGLLIMPVSQFLFFAIAGFSWGHYLSGNLSQKCLIFKPKPTRLLYLLIAIAALLYTVTGLPRPYVSITHGVFHPRFWADGWL